MVAATIFPVVRKTLFWVAHKVRSVVNTIIFECPLLFIAWDSGGRKADNRRGRLASKLFAGNKAQYLNGRLVIHQGSKR
jgi:hypothetical protein